MGSAMGNLVDKHVTKIHQGLESSLSSERIKRSLVPKEG